jgi:hypothetical protein
MSRAFWQGFRDGMNPMCAVAWLLFWAGHAISLTLNWPGFWRLYPVYNWLMLRSLRICELFRFSAPWECNE